MSIHRVLLERSTVHDYSAAPIPEGALLRGLEAALAAPNHRMTEPWRFTQPGPRTREQLVEIAIELKAGGAAPRPELVEKTQRKMLHPAHLVVVSRVRAPDPEVEREDYAAVACAIQNLALSLWAEGVGTKWSTGAVTKAEASYLALGIDPTQEEIDGFIWVGMAASGTTKTKRRKALDDVLRQLP